MHIVVDYIFGQTKVKLSRIVHGLLIAIAEMPYYLVGDLQGFTEEGIFSVNIALFEDMQKHPAEISDIYFI